MRRSNGLPTIATFVEPELRPQLDAAARGAFYSVHARSITEVARAVKERPVSTLFVSPCYMNSDRLSGMEDLVRSFPALSTVAVVSSRQKPQAETLLDMGASGVRKLVNLCDRNGWGRLREIASEPVNAAVSNVINAVLPPFDHSTSGFKTFLKAMVRVAPETTTVRQFCRHVSVNPTTVMSRFLRAGLPSPRTYLSWIRLIHAAGMAEDPGLSLSDIAYRLDHSSPQSFGRHIKTLVGCTAGQFRRQFDARETVRLFVKRIVVPHRAKTVAFEPLPTGMRLGQRG